MRSVKVGSDFSGVGAFDYAIGRVAEAKGFKVDTIYACDWDKYARITYAHNHGEPPYYPKDVYEREIPSESLDIYMTSPPCQAFSLAGKRLGKQDKRGILFFNSHEFIQQNKPRFFIFENVKGLLSDDGGKTFSEWINMLGGKSVNGMPVLFPHEDAVPYHIYWRVLNSKEHGVPQNRERVFIVGIRDDEDNSFRWPLEEPLTRRLKDVLENQVDDKYFLSEQTIDKLIAYDTKQKENGNGFGAKFHSENEVMSALKVGGGGCDDLVKIKSVLVSKEVRSDESKRKRKETGTNDFRGKKVEFREQDHINTVTTSLTNDHLLKIGDYRTDEGFRWRQDGNSPAIMAMMRDTWKDNFTGQNPPIINKDYKIRRLTPRECFRLQDFPDSFDFSVVSDSQAYKQAGNSITVRVLEKILMNLPI